MAKHLKIKIAIVLLIIISLLVGYKFELSAFLKNKNAETEEGIKNTSVTNLVSSEENAIQNTSNLTGQSEQKNNGVSHKADRDIAEWSKLHGYFDPSDHRVYQGYDFKTLASLAKQNDLLASQVLAQKLVIAKEIKKAFPAYNHSIVLGSTSSLNELAKLSIGSKLFKSNLDAYYQLSVLSKYADMRGDSIASESIAKLAAPFNVIGPAPDTVLQKINMAAQEYYSRLEEERRSLGLGKFEN